MTEQTYDPFSSAKPVESGAACQSQYWFLREVEDSSIEKTRKATARTVEDLEKESRTNGARQKWKTLV